MPIRCFESHTPSIAATAYIDDTAVVIGNVQIGSDSSIWPGVILRGDIHQITIGEGTNIQDHTVVHVTHAGQYNPEGFATHVGNHVIVGHRAVLHGCVIKEHCLIGMGVMIMDGAIIESDNLIAAGSLVPPNKHLESGFLWMGSPVKKIRELTSEEKEHIRYSGKYYVGLKNRYLV